MMYFNVTGMSCAACSARVERAVSKVEGVRVCSVNLLTNSMSVEGNASAQSIIEAVEAAGYGAEEKNGDNHIKVDRDNRLEDKETPIMLKRLAYSAGFLIILMYFSMGHMMWGWRLPDFFKGNFIAIGMVQLLLTIAVMVINQKFFINGIKGLINRAPNMDTLVALGSGASFVYSVYQLFIMSDAQLRGDSELLMSCANELYFESAAMILALITVGKMLEARSKGKTTDAIKALMGLAPKTAVIIEAGREKEISIDEIKRGDIFVVKAGESIPADGRIIEGTTAIDESSLTGESIPVDKLVGDNVSAATINCSGYIKCEALRVGEDTTLSQIIKMVENASASKAPIAKLADRVSGVFVPSVIAIAILTIIIWLMLGESVGFALARGISVLVISCPCALGLATPVAIMVGSGVGARNSIMFKSAEILEQTGKAQIVALDKTGTITKGQPEVTDIYAMENEEELIRLSYSIEKKSEHPLARAIVRYAENKGIFAEEITEFKALSGNGVEGRINGKPIFGSNMKYIEKRIKLSEEIKAKAEALAEQGKTPLFFSYDDKLLGMIAVADTIKEESAEAIAQLKNMGLRVVMLTGDNEKTAGAIGRLAGVDEVIAGVMPEGKQRAVEELKRQGRTIMVGDGINDAPALTSADTGMAIGTGTDIAIDAAEVVLMKSSLLDVPAAIRLSRQVLKNIKENLFWAFFYNVIGIPLAAGVFIAIFGWRLNPMFGAAAMSLSSFCVVSNALRLNLFKLYNPKRDRKIKSALNAEKVIIKEEKTMEKTMKIEGMMCGHCEARVKKTLEAIEGVSAAQVSHEEGTAIVSLSAEVSDTILKEAIEAQDYKVTGIE